MLLSYALVGDEYPSLQLHFMETAMARAALRVVLWARNLLQL
jgi:hypothetical protein